MNRMSIQINNFVVLFKFIYDKVNEVMLQMYFIYIV
jgi:hypothetical protein